MENNEKKAYLHTVGARLAITRGELGFTQSEIAKFLGISGRSYQNYELGQGSIPIEALYELHRNFGTDINWVLLGVSAPAAHRDFQIEGESAADSSRKRLVWLMEQVSSLVGEKCFSVSILAEAIGEDTPDRLERVLAGNETAPFKVLDRISDYCSADASWLKHGNVKPFPSKIYDGKDKDEFCDDLLSPPVSRLHFVRSDTPEGEILVVKQKTDKDFMNYKTRIRMSNMVGNEGEYKQIKFLEMFQKISRSGADFVGYIVKSETFRAIANGEEHPLLTLKNQNRSYWADDWWDEALLKRDGKFTEYWEGFNELVQGLHKRLQGKGSAK